MNAVKFKVVVGSERVIPLPEGIHLAPGIAEVIVLQPTHAEEPQPKPREATSESPSLRAMVQRLGNLAEELGIHGLPSDLAENHDHYIHGSAKRTDHP